MASAQLVLFCFVSESEMASLMDSFEQQYAALSAEITAKTSRLSNLSGGTKLFDTITLQSIHISH